MRDRPTFVFALRVLVVLTFVLSLVPVSLAAPVAAPDAPLANPLRISQVYGGGGNTGATYKNDFIELFNAGATSVNVSGWSVQYASSTGTSWQVTNLSGTIAPGQYYLIKQAAGSGGTVDLPPPDATGNIAMSATAGKVALVNSTTALSGSCPTSGIVDFVGYGSGTNCYEGSGPTPAPSNTTAVLRAGNGCTDTDNNASDFSAGAPNPRNTSSPTNSCVIDTPPTVTSTTPANGATGVAVSANITVNFSEVVDVTASAFTLECPTGTPVAFTPTPSLPANDVTSVTLDPDSNLPYSTTCTVTVIAAAVVDNDGTPHPMTADYVFSFTTEAADPCSLSFTPIYTIQGSGPTTPIPGSVTTQGVVVGDYELPTGSGQIRGFYLQDLTGDGDPATSDGIFVYTGGANLVSLGQVVRVSGTAGEYAGQTQISSPTVIQCNTTANVTPVDVTLPFPSADYPERFEGMLVRLPQTLYVTEHYQLGRFGQIVMTSRLDRLQQPTNVVAPGAPALALQAANNLDRIIIDDDNNLQNPDPILFGRGGNPLSASNTLRGGDTATGIIGVLVYDWAGNSASPAAYRVRPVGALNGGVPNFQPANPRPSSPSVGGRLQVTAFNLLNYFNTFGTGACTLGVGGGATDCRGAESAAEFDRQWPKTVAAILGTGADVIGVMEMENDGYGPTSAIQDLVNRLNNATSAGTFAFIDADTLTGQTNALGTDAIKVGLIYKPALVTPVGATAALNTTAFVNGGDSTARNRPALAQAFEEVGTGERFIIVVNHLKSKGSPCDAPDAGDGQGNCNIVRTNAATELVNWLATNPTGTGDPDIMIVGDLNSYAMEDPITVIKNAGYVNLIQQWIGPNAYSYVFDGQWGYLDHALAAPMLADQVTGVAEWHINADEPPVLDYNLNFKSPGQQSSLYAADEFRSSDHDPVVIGLNLAAPNQSNLAGYGQAWHTGAGTVRLGSAWAKGNGTADNDGVAPTPNFLWSDAGGGSVDVTVTGADGWVTGWVDWNDDGDFADSGEQIFTNLNVVAGNTVTQPFSIPVPVGSQAFNARFRVYPGPQTLLAALQPDAPPSPVGGASGGEVEDYSWSFGPNALGLASFRAASAASFDGFVVTALAVVLLLFGTRRLSRFWPL